MDENKAALTKTIAILLSVTPETLIGKFLRLCLEAKVDQEIAGETPLEVAEEFMAQPESISYWAEQIILADGELNDQEWQALEELKIEDLEQFLADFWAELEAINLS